MVTCKSYFILQRFIRQLRRQ